MPKPQIPQSQRPEPQDGERRVDLPAMTRGAELQPSTWNETDRTIDVIWSTGAAVARRDWYSGDVFDEVLDMDPASVRLDRLNSGASVLNTHGQYQLEDIIGSVVQGSARVQNGLGTATLRLSSRDDISGIVSDIVAGHIRNISVGYITHRSQDTVDNNKLIERRATDWEPVEISFVPVPADAGAQVRSNNPQGLYPCIIAARTAAPSNQETEMPKQVEANDEAARGNEPSTEVRAAAPVIPAAANSAAVITITEIRRRATEAGLPSDQILDMVSRHENTPFTRETMGDHLIEQMISRQSPVNTVTKVSVTRDEGDTRRQGLVEALSYRANPGKTKVSDLSEPAREMRHFGLLRMAETWLETQGQMSRGMSSSEIASRALMSTSDFPNLLADTINKSLRTAYNGNVPSYRRWASRGPNAVDFKQISVTTLSGMPDLVAIGEGGEIKYGNLSDGKETYSLVSYGRVIGLTRKAIINDDLGAFNRIPAAYAGSAARLENRLAYAQLTANANMADGVALFHATHANLAGTSAAISVTALGVGRAAMRLQKGLQSEELNIAPAFLIAPATQEALAYQYTSSQFVPALSGSVNEFRAGGRTALEPVIEAVLDGTSTTAWYLVADPSQIDTVEYRYLDGNEGIQLQSQIGFNTNGVEFSAVHDFAAKAVDYRGMFKNAGA
jgi:hypothetical protein